MVPRRLFHTLLSVLLASCASQKPAWQEQGYASYVADAYTGRPTSSGQLYHPQAYTAAHHSLPFGTIITVKNTQTGRVVNVTVNDRFPYYPGRVINLSSIAAQHIGIPYMSMAPVTVTARSLQPGYNPAPQQQTSWQAPAAPAPQPAWQPQPAPYAAPAPGTAPPAQASAPAAPPPAQQSAPRRWLRNPFSSTPSAPQYQGGSGPPPGLQTF